jgi:hypothetical protein
MKRLVPVQPVLWSTLLVLFGAGCGPSIREVEVKQQVETISKRYQPADATLKRLVVHDFDRPRIQNNLGGNAGTWNLDPTDSKSDCTYILDAQTKRGTEGNSLYLAYRLNPNKSSQNGFWMSLNRLDARGYDHLELWVKGDPKQGFAKSLKIEVKQPKPDSPGETLKGSYVIQGITDEWQRFRIPLNMMTGIETWKDLDVFVIGFHSRREKVTQGAVFIDDIAFVKTGDPGPSIRDPVPVPKKRAWEQAHGGEVAAQPFVIQRLAGWPATLLADKSSFPKDDREFLLRVARDTWTGISVTGSIACLWTRCASATTRSIPRKAAPAITRTSPTSASTFCRSRPPVILS